MVLDPDIYTATYASAPFDTMRYALMLDPILELGNCAMHTFSFTFPVSQRLIRSHFNVYKPSEYVASEKDGWMELARVGCESEKEESDF